MGVSERWVRKLLKRMAKQGDAVVVHGLRGRPSNRKLAGEDAEASAGDSEAAGLARFWADVRRRTVGQASSDPGGQRDAARVDDRGRDVEEQVARGCRRCMGGGRGGADSANWCNGTPPSTTGWKGEGRCATWCG